LKPAQKAILFVYPPGFPPKRVTVKLIIIIKDGSGHYVYIVSATGSVFCRKKVIFSTMFAVEHY